MSTYTTNSGLELIAIGEQAGTWGTTTNTNWEMTDKLVNGVKSVALSDGTNNLTTVEKKIPKCLHSQFNVLYVEI